MRFIKVIAVISFIIFSVVSFSLVVSKPDTDLTQEKVLTTNSEKRDAVWYYDHLTAEDRLKIRAAFDMTIPRESIIDGILQGFGAPLATPISEFMTGFNPAVVPREYNPVGALDLLEQVFGYR
ncbi:MAG: hypothetical protein KAT16_04295, partial [Candidatus Heimdallarchaeota archaeon]|nr:hypothetical protein [Candidatus Heimdallarchaeota archaeon]